MLSRCLSGDFFGADEAAGRKQVRAAAMAESKGWAQALRRSYAGRSGLD